MCKHDAINIQHAHCGLQALTAKKIVPSVRCLERVFIRAKPKPVCECECETHCLSLAATSSSLSLLQK